MRTQTDTQKPRNNNKKHHAFEPVPVAITHSLSPTPVRSHAYARTTNDLGHTQTHTHTVPHAPDNDKYLTGGFRGAQTPMRVSCGTGTVTHGHPT